MNKFPWNCGECPMLRTYDLSIDDLTYICLWSKSQIDDCDRHKSAECPMEKHDEEIRVDEREKVIEEVLKLPKHIYKTYESGFIENHDAIFVGDIERLKEKK